MATDPTRRRVLHLASGAGAVALAGCSTVIGGLADDDAGEPTAAPGANGATRADDSARTARPTSDGSDASEPQSEPDPTTESRTESTTESWSPADVTIEEPPTSLASTPIGNTAARYARMGTGEAETTATLFGNWKCPYTRSFVLTQLPDVVDRFVATGRLNVEFRSLAYVGGTPFLGDDAPRSSRAGIAVWNVDPSAFWSYLETVFYNQPQERYEWGQTDLLVRFATAADVDGADTVERSIETDLYSDDVAATTSAASRLGIGTVPRVAVDGEVTAPTVRPDETMGQLERAADE